MTQTIDVIYEDGVLKPLEPVQLEEHQRVTVEIQSVRPLLPDEILELAHQVYAGLSEEEIAEIEEIALDRSNFMRPAE